MFSSINCLLSYVILLLYISKTCIGDIPTGPSLALYAEGSPEYAAVLVRRVGENMKLVCELRGQSATRYVWNYMPEDNSTQRVSETATSSTLIKTYLQESDSGQYMCSAPPFSVTKYILVQPPGPKNCGRGTFWCGLRCMAAMYVCDGRRDCTLGEDEDTRMCGVDVCSRSDKLNCSTGRCISESACCRSASLLCQQPSCCQEHPRYSTVEGFPEVEFPPLQDDRHAPDDYGFIQSTIYTVTACALIFMIAVVLLVSAICKMHMKRAALRSYAHAERATRQHYSLQYAQSHRFPPCYEASRLLEQDRVATPVDTHASPGREQTQQCGSPAECVEAVEGVEAAAAAERGLARLSSIFSSRYRQVPTQSDVELQAVRSTSLNSSPSRSRPLVNYRSPTYCDLNSTDFYFTEPDTAAFGRDLNIMPSCQYRPGPIDRVIDQMDRQRLTLQLGRFQLTIPRFGRRNDNDRRPDTPNVAEINIEDLDFVRMASNDTYTLNGRTIRLLGANFENYPVLPDGTRPPPYNEAMRHKFFGPPPEYLSREVLNARVDEEARNNIEMPPCYDELSGDSNGNNGIRNGTNNGNTGIVNGNNSAILINVIPPDSCNTLNSITNDVSESVTGNEMVNTLNNGCNNALRNNGNPVITITNTDENNVNNNSLNSIIDNLPAIDSDVNANDTLIADPNSGVTVTGN